jgi:hypothetical protein
VTTDRGLRLLAVVVGGVIALQGVWAFLAPRSFYDTLATFEPFNAHFIRDIGAFQIGIGVAGVVGALRTTAIVVGLTGLAVFQTVHVVSHIVDRNAGGRPGIDIPALGLAAVVTVIGLVVAVRQARAAGEPLPTGGERVR